MVKFGQKSFFSKYRQDRALSLGQTILFCFQFCFSLSLYFSLSSSIYLYMFNLSFSLSLAIYPPSLFSSLFVCLCLCVCVCVRVRVCLKLKSQTSIFPRKWISFYKETKTRKKEFFCFSKVCRKHCCFRCSCNIKE